MQDTLYVPCQGSNRAMLNSVECNTEEEYGIDGGGRQKKDQGRTASLLYTILEYILAFSHLFLHFILDDFRL